MTKNKSYFAIAAILSAVIAVGATQTTYATEPVFIGQFDIEGEPKILQHVGVYKYSFYFTSDPVLMSVSTIEPELDDTINITCSYDQQKYELSYMEVYHISESGETKYDQISHVDDNMSAGRDYTFTEPGDYHVACRYLGDAFQWLGTNFWEVTIVDPASTG